jgi:hypothetical protein
MIKAGKILRRFHGSGIALSDVIHAKIQVTGIKHEDHGISTKSKHSSGPSTRMIFGNVLTNGCDGCMIENLTGSLLAANCSRNRTVIRTRIRTRVDGPLRGRLHIGQLE